MLFRVRCKHGLRAVCGHFLGPAYWAGCGQRGWRKGSDPDPDPDGGGAHLCSEALELLGQRAACWSGYEHAEIPGSLTSSSAWRKPRIASSSHYHELSILCHRHCPSRKFAATASGIWLRLKDAWRTLCGLVCRVASRRHRFVFSIPICLAEWAVISGVNAVFACQRS